VCLILDDIPSVPYTLTIAVPEGVGTDLSIALLDSVSGKFIEVFSSGGMVYYDDFMTYNASVPYNSNFTGGGLSSNISWGKIQDDGVNLISSTSKDGVNFNIACIVSRTDFVVPTKYGVVMQATVNNPPFPQISQPYLLSLKITTP